MRYADGSNYRGQWEKGERHGRGIFCDTYGRQFKGLFEGDLPVGPNWNHIEQAHPIASKNFMARPSD